VNKCYSFCNPENFVLLKTSSDGSESLCIAGLLESYGVEVYIKSEGIAPITGMMDEPIPQYSIFVNKHSLNDAKRLLEASNLYNEEEFREYKQIEQKRGAFWGRIIALIFAAFFYALSSLPIKESDKSMQYVLIGASLFFVLLFIFSFYKGSLGGNKTETEKGTVLFRRNASRKEKRDGSI